METGDSKANITQAPEGAVAPSGEENLKLGDQTSNNQLSVTVDGHELIKMHVEKSMADIKNTMTDEITTSILKTIEQKLDSKIQLIKQTPKESEYEQWLNRIVGIANSYKI